MGRESAALVLQRVRPFTVLRVGEAPNYPFQVLVRVKLGRIFPSTTLGKKGRPVPEGPGKTTPRCHVRRTSLMRLGRRRAALISWQVRPFTILPIWQ